MLNLIGGNWLTRTQSSDIDKNDFEGPSLGINLHVENHQTTNLSVNSLAMGEHQEVDFLAMGEHQEENSQSPKHDENFSG